MEEIDAQIYICHYKTLKTIASDHQPLPSVLDDPRVGVWYWGKTGTGKSHAARMDFPDAYLKVANTKWWCGYNGEDNVIIDDFDKAHDYMGYHLKIWVDKYPFRMEVKGGGKPIRPKKICVTSNYHPRDIWDDSSTLDPILRRFRVVHFVNPFDQVLEGLEETRDAYANL